MISAIGFTGYRDGSFWLSYLAWRRMARTGDVEWPEPAKESPNWTLTMAARHGIRAGLRT